MCSIIEQVVLLNILKELTCVVTDVNYSIRIVVIICLHCARIKSRESTQCRATHFKERKRVG